LHFYFPIVGFDRLSTCLVHFVVATFASTIIIHIALALYPGNDYALPIRQRSPKYYGNTKKEITFSPQEQDQAEFTVYIYIFFFTKLKRCSWLSIRSHEGYYLFVCILLVCTLSLVAASQQDEAGKQAESARGRTRQVSRAASQVQAHACE
jgi:hypothetical protein